MKMLIALLMVLATATCGWADSYDAAERFSGEYATSYAFHYAAGAVIGGGTVLLIPDDWNIDPWQKWLLGIGLAVLVKGTMEVFDDYPDAWDVAEFGVGAALGGGVVTLISIDF